MATIYDVAQLAGVSHTAVSAVINNKPIRIRETTRQRILEAAKTLGYQTNRVAQQLSTGKFNTLALCFAKEGSRVFASTTNNRLVAGIVNRASDHDLYVLFAPTQRTHSLGEALAKLSSQGVDGAVVVGPVPLASNGISPAGRRDVPVVYVDAHPGLASSYTVAADSFGGVKMGVERLIAMGHTRMAYIGPAPEFQCLLDRMRGFYQAVTDAGLSMADQTTHVAPRGDVPAVVRRLVAADNGPTALVCASEETTRAVLDEVMRLGLRIPDDLCVLSYDDVPGHTLSESIHAIRNDFFAMGEAAVDLLRKLTSGESPEPTAVRLLPELVMRTEG